MDIKMYNLVMGNERHPELVTERTFPYPKCEHLNNPDLVAQMIEDMFNADQQVEEYVWLICLDCDAKPTGVFEVSHGSLNSAFVDMRSIFSRALLTNATGIIVVHNHPSGNPKLSEDDEMVYRKLKDASELMDIKLLDFLVTGTNGRYESLW